GDFGGVADGAERNLCGVVGVGVRVGVGVAVHLGVDVAGADGVDPDAARSQVGAEGAGQVVDGGLGGGVDRGDRQAAVQRPGGVEDDRAAFAHQRKSLLHGEEHALEVDVD